MGWRWLSGVFPAAGTDSSRRSATNASDTHVLPEIVQDVRTDNQALWLTVGIFVVMLAAGGGYYVGRTTVPAQLPASADDYDDTPTTPATHASTVAPGALHRRTHAHAGEPQGAAVIAAAKPTTATMYVHRMNSDVRDQPSYDAKVIKKEAKGAQVQLIALSDKWAEVKDGPLQGWMRSSVLKDTPPGAKRKKDAGN
jgi:hypothetical protein